jgi:hypothetical protein
MKEATKHGWIGACQFKIQENDKPGSKTNLSSK